MKPSPEQLSQLADIKLPDAPSFWPPAWGWFALFISIAVAVIVGFMLYRKKKQQQWKQDTLHMLNQLRDRSQQSIDKASQALLLAELNQLLKRVSLTCHQTHEVSHLQGDCWLAFLDESSHPTKSSNQFRAGPGQILKFAPYQDRIQDESLKSQQWEALFNLCERWLKQQAIKRGK